MPCWTGGLHSRGEAACGRVRRRPRHARPQVSSSRVCIGGSSIAIPSQRICSSAPVSWGVQQGDPLGPLLFSLVLHPLALKIQESFPRLDLCVWYLDDGTIVGPVDVVFQAFKLLQVEGPALGLVLNVRKNEIWWPSRASSDPFPEEVDRVDNAVGSSCWGRRSVQGPSPPSLSRRN